MGRLAKIQDQKETKTKTHKRSKIFRKNPEAIKWISGMRMIVYCRCTGHRHTLVWVTDGQVVFLRVLRFSPTFDERSARYK